MVVDFYYGLVVPGVQSMIIKDAEVILCQGVGAYSGDMWTKIVSHKSDFVDIRHWDPDRYHKKLG